MRSQDDRNELRTRRLVIVDENGRECGSFVASGGQVVLHLGGSDSPYITLATGVVEGSGNAHLRIGCKTDACDSLVAMGIGGGDLGLSMCATGSGKDLRLSLGGAALDRARAPALSIQVDGKETQWPAK
jgi:hypothetical protein